MTIEPGLDETASGTDEPAATAPADIEPTGETSDEAPSTPLGAAPLPVPADPWNQWIATALAGDRVGLAFHLASARDLAGGDAAGVPVAVLEAVLHGRATRAAYDGAWRRYEDLRDPLLAQVLSIGSAAGDQACALLLAAGAMRPALVQSQVALEVLDRLGGDIAARLRPLIRAICETKGSGARSLDELAAPVGADERGRRIAAAREALEQWRSGAPSRKTNYQPATSLWLALIAADGAVGRVVAAVLDGDAGAAEQARALSERLADKDEAEALIVEVDTARIGRRHHPIEGGALRQLLNFCAGAAELLARWAQVEAGTPDGGDRHRSRRAVLLRELRAARDIAIALAPSGSSLAVAADRFAAEADALRAVLEGEPASSSDWSPDDELALLPGFPLNARRDLRIEPDDVLALAGAAEPLAEGALPGPAAAFARALALENASAARRLLDRLPAERRAAAAAELDRAVADARRRVTDRARELRQRLDDLQIALAADDLPPDAIEREMSVFEQAKIDELPLDSAERGDLADFPAAHHRLDAIEARLGAARAPIAERLEKSIAAEEARFDAPLDECRLLLAKGDLGTLTESVAQIREHGLSPPRPASSVELLRRFGDTVAALGEQSSPNLISLQRAAREGGVEGPFDFDGLSQADRSRAEQMLKDWTALKRAARGDVKGDALAAVKTALAGVLTAAGFTSVRVEQGAQDRALFRLTVTTNPLRERSNCLAPAFGSEANGRYAVVVIPDGGVRSALTLFDKLPEQVLLIATEALTPRMRRDLQRQARAGTRSVALIDMVTAAVLASEPDAGTRALFDLALPFGAARPYADTSAQTSLEMFFGREREYDSLVDRQGACLVYGGRQLGKTALLKQVELRISVGDDRVAIYLDIRPVGESRPPEDVWSLVEKELARKRVKLPEGRSVADRLKGWLHASPGRYLLILLDEADAFLEAEMAHDFPQIGRMKTLMDDTGRGVKFVFAGLHNVQRFHRAPNSPLLHFGKSINVGPLVGRDREAARQMALEPMAALGIAYDQPVVDASHMLSLVGYYPSLMQSFGKAVVAEVDARLRQPGDEPTMPFAIGRDLIAACFEQQEFRAGVVQRFQKTLQLDERYELITYAVWQQALQDARGGRPTARGGYPASEIRKMADLWWPAGFRDTDSPDSFGAILDEMVEMGVLARDGERYGLRSQRIAAMLGSEAEIGDQLESFSDRAPKRRADPMTSHRRMGAIWSPMSLRQEATLADRLGREEDAAGLVLIGATPASGSEDLSAALKSLTASLDWPEPREIGRQRAEVILDVARSVRREGRPGRPKLVVVRDAWPSVAEIAELRRHRLLRDPAHPVRVIYHGLPQADVLKLDETGDWFRLMLGPLPLEAMVHWMSREELGFARDEEVQRRLRRATGGLLQLLDAIKLPAGERQDADRLLARAAATAIGLEDFGLDAAGTAFARALRDVIGDEAYPDRDLRAWAVEHDPTDGADRLDMLRALGVVEPVAGADDSRPHALNPAAFRALA